MFITIWENLWKNGNGGKKGDEVLALFLNFEALSGVDLVGIT